MMIDCDHAFIITADANIYFTGDAPKIIPQIQRLHIIVDLI